MLAAFAVVSVWVLALDLWQVLAHARVWTGTDGVYLVDQMQYLAWIRDSSRHVLVSNLFVLRATSADYFQPLVVISGAVSALGVAPWLSLLLWKPVAVGTSFFAVRAYVHRSLPGRWARRVALVLALFFGSFTIVYGSFGVLGDLFPGFLSWGYVFGLIALAAMVGALVAYERAREGNRLRWMPALLGGLASLVHPWNGELLILLVIGSELVLRVGRGRCGRPWRLVLPAVTTTVTAAPLAYYAILGQTDVSWQLAREASKHAFSFFSIALAIAPLLLPAMIAYRGRPESFLAAATRAWPIAAFALFALSGTDLGATPLHAFQGITIPLAILAVEGIQRAGYRQLPYRMAIGTLAVALLTIPATALELSDARKLLAPSAENGNFITPDERAALDYLAHDRAPGGVLTRSYLGAVIPGWTGRHTLVGDCVWSEPHCLGSTRVAQTLFDGTLGQDAARSFVQRSGARFLLADCQASADLKKLLGPIIGSVQRFGCAAVYEIRAVRT
ncbi:MAG: hypothetical protein ACR2LV_01980 [Solirubrobacteraceae bacterium]